MLRIKRAFQRHPHYYFFFFFFPFFPSFFSFSFPFPLSFPFPFPDSSCPVSASIRAFPRGVLAYQTYRNQMEKKGFFFQELDIMQVTFSFLFFNILFLTRTLIVGGSRRGLIIFRSHENAIITRTGAIIGLKRLINMNT